MNSQPALEHVSEVRAVRVKNRVEMGTIFGANRRDIGGTVMHPCACFDLGKQMLF